MKTKKINESEISPLKISALPSRPTLPTQYGGKGYSASDMKNAFDALPLLIIERLNSLFDDISATADEGIATEICTGNELLPKLTDIFSGIDSGRLCEALTLSNGDSLAFVIFTLLNDVKNIKSRLGI
jgi:hypothetical protein